MFEVGNDEVRLRERSRRKGEVAIEGTITTLAMKTVRAWTVKGTYYENYDLLLLTYRPEEPR